ncbi:MULTISPECIES: hypothetical protein [Polymorphospora]|uniref:CHAT domain-containing protein n=1 Tax=Polymorphospora lycopeni TaxID=3140240 RepID=A0ABV5CVL8_9ACTN
MIITVCTDDDLLVREAEKQSRQNPRVYGTTYRVFSQVIPRLGVDEDLFVSSHGAYDGTGWISPPQPVIGDKKKDLFLTAGDLYVNLEHLLPADYRGRIFVSACESADAGGPAAMSFVDRLATTLGAHGHGGIAVYGQRGAVGMRIPAPNDPGWIRAA